MKVSVVIITYNQEKFIAQAIESALMQKTDFSHEIVIGEDCSIDSTRDIVIGFQRRYPHRIRVLLSQNNLGPQHNFIRTLQACRAQYVALLEGDDYWTRPYKLQKQSDFLDSHRDCATCFHNVTRIYEDGSHEPHDFNSPEQKEISTIEDLLDGNFIHTCSAMFRRGLIVRFPDWFYRVKMGDWSLHILNAQYGNVGYINEAMANYRVHDKGIWMGLSWPKKYEAKLDVYRHLETHLNARHKSFIVTNLLHGYHNLALTYRDSGNIAKARKYIRLYLIKTIFSGRMLKRKDLKLFATIYYPKLSKPIWTIARHKRIGENYGWWINKKANLSQKQMAVTNKVNIIIITRNNLECLTKSTTDIYQKTDFPFELIVVDNSSDIPEVISYLKRIERRNDTRILWLPKNLFYFPAINLALKIIDRNNRYTLILNDDVEIYDDQWIQYFISIIEREENIAYVGDFMKRLFCPPLGGWIDGWCMFFRTEIFGKVGFFSEKYIWWYGPADYAVRTIKVGYDIEDIKRQGDRNNHVKGIIKHLGGRTFNTVSKDASLPLDKMFVPDFKFEDLLFEHGLYKYYIISKLQRVYSKINMLRSYELDQKT